jgi:hypothetical protein
MYYRLAGKTVDMRLKKDNSKANSSKEISGGKNS